MKKKNLPKAIAFAAALSVISGYSVRAASDSWNTATSGTWATSGNWLGGNVPGTSGDTGNTDTATFGFTLVTTATTAVTVDSNRNIQNITFAQTNGSDGVDSTHGGYNLTGGSLLLTNGAVVQNSSAVTGSVQNTVASNITLLGNGSSFTFRNDATGSTSGLRFTGTITGSSTTGNTTTITLDGVNTASGTGANGRNNAISAVISDGANGGKVAIVKNGTGTWTLSGGNSFSGGVTANGGTVRYFGSGNVFGTGTVTINNSVTFTHANTSDTLFNNNVMLNGNATFSGTAFTTTGHAFGGNWDLNGGNRTITANLAIRLSGVISNGTLTKAGTNTLTLSGANTYVGNTTVSAGTMVLSDNAQLAFAIGASGINNQVNGSGTLNLDGDFSFDLSGAGVGLGNSWTIVDVASLTETFGTTFSVLGFTDNLDDTWSKVNGGITYTFSESTGILSVTAIPEPATWALLAAGLTVTMVLRRRRNA